MRKVFTDLQSISDTATGTFTPSQECDTYRVSVFGAGSGSAQPYINGSSDHKAYTITDDTYVLELSGVEKFEITASGGAITAMVAGYRG